MERGWYLSPPADYERTLTVPETFQEACYLAAEEGIPLVLTQDATLTDTIRLKNQQSLTIRGVGSDDQMGRVVSISGHVHSLFLLNNKSELALEDVDLRHLLETDDHKQVGAAVNLRYKGSLSIKNSTITTISGFCVWAVQKSKVILDNCRLDATTRSPMVCFGQATCSLQHCHIENAGVHAVCARGACQIHLSHCTIEGSVARAVYAYANASVTLDHCHIAKTIHADKAAVEVSAAGSNSRDSASALILRNCHIVDNKGVGVRIRGEVSCLSENNILERNSRGDWEQTASLVDDTGNSIRRDAAGSSFRRGDWWCTKCRKILVRETCPTCGMIKSDGRLLTAEEITQCNQGIDIRMSLEKACRPNGGEMVTQASNMIWWFDRDDEWIPYDMESCRVLEEAYQKYGMPSSATDAPTVLLAGGKYQVNVQRLEQINIETQFLRLVRRGNTA